MRTSRPGKQSGFTLIELIVVLILLGAAAAVVIPSFTGGFLGLRLETASRDLVTRMRQARVEAVAKQSVFRIILGGEEQLDEAKYALADEYGRALKSYDLPEGISLALEAPLTISFYPNGRSSGGSFGLKKDGGGMLTIQVDPVTGFGRVVKDAEDG